MGCSPLLPECPHSDFLENKIRNSPWAAENVASLAIPALCVGYTLGSCGGTGAQPIWVAAFIKNGFLTPSQTGWIASGELFLLAVSNLAMSAFGQRVSPRFVAVVAASLVVLANVVAMFPIVQTLVVGRLLSGLAIGALYSAVAGTAARRMDAQRVFAVMQGSVMLVSSGLYSISASIVGRYGPAGIFGLIAGLGVATAMVALLGFSDSTPEATQVAHASNAMKLAPLLGCLGLGSIGIGAGTLWTYIFTIGNGLGFATHTIGTVLGVAGPIALLGPVAAHTLGERAGLLLPLLIGLLVVVVDYFFTVNAGSPVLFGISSAVLGTGAAFCMPYATALVSRLDSSGRFASAMPAFILVGAASGPAIGGKLISLFPFQVLATVAASFMIVSILLFWCAARLGGIAEPAACEVERR